MSQPEDAKTNDFKRKYLEFTELLDRATSQLESLLQAKTKGRTPTRLKITTKLVVVCSEDEDLKTKYAQGCRQGKLLLIEVLLNYLEKVIKDTKSILQDISRDAYKAFKKVNVKTAKTNNMEDALKTVNMKQNKELKTEKRENSRQPRADLQRNQGTTEQQLEFLPYALRKFLLISYNLTQLCNCQIIHLSLQLSQ